MRWNFGDRDMQEEMKTNPLLRFDPAFEQKPTRALREKDYLVNKVGINLYQAVSQTYEAYLAKPDEKTAKKYCTWRLRLHQKFNNNRELLENFNTKLELGLFNEDPGKLCWDLDFN